MPTAHESHNPRSLINLSYSTEKWTTLSAVDIYTIICLLHKYDGPGAYNVKLSNPSRLANSMQIKYNSTYKTWAKRHCTKQCTKQTQDRINSPHEAFKESSSEMMYTETGSRTH